MHYLSSHCSSNGQSSGVTTSYWIKNLVTPLILREPFCWRGPHFLTNGPLPTKKKQTKHRWTSTPNSRCFQVNKASENSDSKNSYARLPGASDRLKIEYIWCLT